jgi:phage baseplate assembly protein W
LASAGATRSSPTRTAATSRYERDVREAIRIILETSPGERVMRPRFGCGIRDLVFAEMSTTTLFAAEVARIFAHYASLMTTGTRKHSP